MEPITVNYKVLDPRAKVPAYATPGAAAADLCAVLDEPLTLAPMQRALVPTGLAIELPGPHAVALVYARSGLSIKHGLCMANGVGALHRCIPLPLLRRPNWGIPSAARAALAQRGSEAYERSDPGFPEPPTERTVEPVHDGFYRLCQRF